MRALLLIGIGILLMAPGVALAGPINVLANPGFETGTFSGWTVGGTSVQTQVNTDDTLITGGLWTGYQNVRAGTYGANALVSYSNNEVIHLGQVVSVQPNTTYSVGFFVGVNTPTQPSYGFSGTSILVNGAALSLTSPGGVTSSPYASGFHHVYGTYTTGATQTTATVSYRITGSGTGRAPFSLDSFHFGDVSTVPNPEPATLALVGAGVAALAWRRRRRRSA